LWCIINNWGGKQGMYGRLSKVGVEMPELLRKKEAGRLSGIGTLNEGGDNNPIVYEQLYEMAWHGKPMNIDAWVVDFAWARYGVNNESAIKAWKILASTLYDCKDLRHGPQGNFLAMPPSLSKDGGEFVRGSIFYDSAKVREAFGLLIDAAEELGDRDTYRFDLVDVGRQVMSDIAQQQLHAELREAYEAKDPARFRRAADAYCQAILDCDRLLSSHTMFQFGRYLKYPLAAGGTGEVRARWERNARRIITLWGEQDSPLFGYAQRQYGGLMRDYNLGCWKLFLDAAGKSLRDGGKLSVDREVREFTDSWISSRKTYPVEAEHDPVAVARMIWEKYAANARAVNGPEAPLKINDVR
jgi:alpha-N-acetylglucosaminidase